MSDFGAFYTAFQQRFRGSYDEIRRRFHAYLPELEKVGAGSSNGAILDLGTGRGEWLDLLGERNLNAEGVDMNPRLSEQARPRGVTVHDSDALAYLRRVQSGTYGAITAFHLIEHLDYDSQLELLEQSYRALRLNGIIIIEWPNIEDIRVATQYFWLDPTHGRPLPHQLLAFMAEFIGYGSIRLLRFRPNPGIPPVATEPRWRIVRPLALERAVADVNRCWNEFLTPGADIALIGQKDKE